jgi:putative PIN family toxin of toxin-antitoxin system
LIRVVLDANVFISGLISNSGPPCRILDAWINNQFHLFVSPQILEELVRVLDYPHIRERLTARQISVFLKQLKRFANKTDGVLKMDILSRDPSDNIYLACAVEAKADYLVTGNFNHFEEARTFFKETKIVSPRDFLDVLGINQ